MKFYTLSAGFFGLTTAKSVTNQCFNNPLSDKVFQTFSDHDINGNALCWGYSFKNMFTSELHRFFHDENSDFLVTDLSGKQVTLSEFSENLLNSQLEYLNDPEVLRFSQHLSEQLGGIYNGYKTLLIDVADNILSNSKFNFNQKSYSEVDFATGFYQGFLGLVNSVDAGYVQNSAVAAANACNPVLQYLKYAFLNDAKVTQLFRDISDHFDQLEHDAEKFKDLNDHIEPELKKITEEFLAEYIKLDLDNGSVVADYTEVIPKTLKTLSTFQDAMNLGQQMLGLGLTPDDEELYSWQKNQQVKMMGLMGTPEFQDIITSWEEAKDFVVNKWFSRNSYDYSSYSDYGYGRVKRSGSPFPSIREMKDGLLAFFGDEETSNFFASRLDNWGAQIIAFISSDDVHNFIDWNIKQVQGMMNSAPWIYTEPILGEYVDKTYTDYYGKPYTWKKFEVTSCPDDQEKWKYTCTYLGRDLFDLSESNPNWAVEYVTAIWDVLSSLDDFAACEGVCALKYM